MTKTLKDTCGYLEEGEQGCFGATGGGFFFFFPDVYKYENPLKYVAIMQNGSTAYLGMIWVALSQVLLLLRIYGAAPRLNMEKS